MLNVTDDVRECYRHAEECARQAQSVSNPEFRRDFLDLELRWLKLARSYEVSERLKPAGTGKKLVTGKLAAGQLPCCQRPAHFATERAVPTVNTPWQA